MKIFQSKETRYIKHLEKEIDRLRDEVENIPVHHEIPLNDKRLEKMLESEYKRGYADAIIDNESHYDSKMNELIWKYSHLIDDVNQKNSQLTDQIIYKSNE